MGRAAAEARDIEGHGRLRGLAPRPLGKYIEASRWDAPRPVARAEPRQTISRPPPEVARRLRDRYPPRTVWVSRSAHASSEYPDLDRFVKPVRPPGADTVK